MDARSAVVNITFVSDYRPYAKRVHTGAQKFAVATSRMCAYRVPLSTGTFSNGGLEEGSGLLPAFPILTRVNECEPLLSRFLNGLLGLLLSDGRQRQKYRQSKNTAPRMYVPCRHDTHIIVDPATISAIFLLSEALRRRRASAFPAVLLACPSPDPD